MATSALKDQILKAIHRRTFADPTKNISVWELLIDFEDVEKPTIQIALQELIGEGMLAVRSPKGTHLGLTRNGHDKLDALVNPPSTTNQNILNVHHAVNSLIQQGIHSHQTQHAAYSIPSNDDLRRLVVEMNAHLSQLELPPNEERNAKVALNTIDAQLEADSPNPVIINEAGRVLKNITEGAIGSLLAAAAQPGIWDFLSHIIRSFS